VSAHRVSVAMGVVLAAAAMGRAGLVVEIDQ